MRTRYALAGLFLLAAALLPPYAAAQERESVPITYVAYTRVTESGAYTNCAWQAVGIHADPVGNGRDFDYYYPFDTGSVYFDGYVDDDPADWTGADDIPGEQITFLGSYYSSSTPTARFDGCKFPSTLPSPDDPNAYFTPPPNEPPTAWFDWSQSQAALFTIDFDASGSDDEDGQIVSYAWDFGDRFDGGGMATSHAYEEPGTYQVTLTVRDDDGDEDETTRTVKVEGPDLRYVVALAEQATVGDAAGKHASAAGSAFLVGDTGFLVGDPVFLVGDPVFLVGDTVRVEVAVTNTGDWPLEAVRLPGGEATIEVTTEPEDALAFVRAEQAEITRLAPGASGTLVYLYEAVHTVEDGSVLVGEVAAETVAPGGGGPIAYDETEATCPAVAGGIAGGPASADGVQAEAASYGAGTENAPCARFAVDPAPMLVNSTEDRPLDAGVDPEEDGCTTGESIDRDGASEPECTLRAALQIAAAQSGRAEIAFDIPGGGAVHRIVLDGEALPAVDASLRIEGGSQPDGVPIEIDGSGLDAEVGFDLQGDETTVDELAFYGFPGTVLALRGRGSVLTGSLVGSDWARSYTSTDPEVTDPLRNGGTAVLVTGDEVRIGGGAGNLIVGSTTGIRVEGAHDVQILGNDVGVLESPHAEHGIDLVEADRAVVGTPEFGNRILYNLEYGVRIDAGTSGATIRNNTITRSRKDGILVNQGAASGDPVVVGGEEEGAGNTIERSIGAGIRVVGSGGEESTVIEGNTLRKNEEIGIHVEGGGVRVGGATDAPGTGAGNDIEDGLRLENATGARVQGNRIALLDHETGFSEAGEAVYVSGTGNVIGGETPAEGNAVYGVPLPYPDENDPSNGEDAAGFGIWDEGTETLIRFNEVGTQGALYTGVVLRGTRAQLFENTISGNSNVGLSVRAVAAVEGNYIGTTPTGNGAMPNGGPGVELWTATRIGGIKDGEACERPCNVISGNTGPGVLVRPEAAGATIYGNMIGVGADGLTAVGNGESGIVVLADDVVIGGENDVELGSCEGPCNIIAANGGDGIRNFEVEEYPNLSSGGPATTLGAGSDGASGLVIDGNFIGTTIPGSGNTGTGNAGSGIALGALGSNNRVGTTGRRGNLIAGNGGAGVLVLASSEPIYIKGTTWRGGTGNRIRGNRIHGNGGLAIDLYPNYVLPGGDGWTALDARDADDGPNTMLNWPYLVESTDGDGASGQNTLLVLWTGDPGTMAGTYALDIYTSASCRGATAEAANFLISRDITFPVGGGANLDAARVDVPFVPSMPYYVATFTDSEGNTSELGNCRRAGERPEQALRDVEPGVRTLVNRLLIQLDDGTSGKAAATQTLMVLRSDAAPEGNLFEATAARTPGGVPVVPRSTQGDYWEVVAPNASDPLRYDACLDASAADAPGDVLVLGRGGATNGAWRPYDTRLETVDGVTYACADGLSALQLTLGSGDEAALATPTLMLPEDGADGVDLSTATLSWQALNEAASYDLQLALEASFTAPLSDTTGLGTPSFAPPVLARSQRHYWRVRGVTAGGEMGPWSVPFRFTTRETSVDTEDADGVPETFVLEANYPNPFNPQTTIAFALPRASTVRLAVYDVLGREVAVLVDGPRAAGRHTATFEAAGLPTGVYLYRLEAEGFVRTRQMLLVK